MQLITFRGFCSSCQAYHLAFAGTSIKRENMLVKTQSFTEMKFGRITPYYRKFST
nr:MAG TPA: hypothetical protein [Caudoviricetes sp.]DAR07576.1 MAG TPA: hypothetical protein [Caudoviricetes sp.]